MYKNCSEHPVIKEILRNGEPREYRDLSELCATLLFFLTEQEFVEICLKRKKAAALQEGNCK
ncbi:MAG: hypothetical protein CVU91_08760 [Firmicutes bacterium HGW-Firmicutes-16]|nr:MAG: hypothetical protein CVU91_08760 [Firmicutes bacterium HGW-Firmicutes-16]